MIHSFDRIPSITTTSVGEAMVAAWEVTSHENRIT